MPAQSVLASFQSFLAGFRLIDGQDLQHLANLEFSTTNGLTALAGGGQSGATPLPSAINEISTVASANDSVALPQALPGTTVVVINDGANSCQVFGQASNPLSTNSAGDTIAAHNSTAQTATGTGVAQASAAVGVYYCFAIGKWKQTLLT